MTAPRLTGSGNNVILRAVVSFLFYLINVFAFYLFLRGHNLPGGGFIGGLGSALSVILLSLAVGVEAAQRVLRVDPVRIAVAGLIVALVSASLPLAFGAPFLTQYNVTLDRVPLVGELPLGTPLVFDAGVFLVVVGVTTKLIFVLARALSGLPALEKSEQRRYAAFLESPIEDRGERVDEGAAPLPSPPAAEGNGPANGGESSGAPQRPEGGAA
ncbi:sodium:proton antiporter [Opitutaceae bacterium TAV5]|nr:sodium:proton antiporter [Opitutaceae bacterium TAV5]